LAISSKKSTWASKKNAEPGREHVDVEPAGQPELDVAEAVGQREGQLLRGGRAGLADVVAGDRQRLVGRDLLGAVLHQVADQPQVRLGPKSHSFWAMYSLKMSVCRVPLSAGCRRPGRSAATSIMQNTGTAGPEMVIEW
jgi:hypothetical protein